MEIIGYNFYSPASSRDMVCTTSNADVDADNMAVTFIVPPSGCVEIELSAYATGAASNRHTWLLRKGANDLLGTEQVVSSDAAVGRKFYKQFVGGLVPGETVTIKWGQRGSAITAKLTAGTNNNFDHPAIMTVYSIVGNAGVLYTRGHGILNGNNYQIMVPSSPGPRPLVLVNHGRGGNEKDFTSVPNSPTTYALLKAGCMVASSNAGGNNFGNNAGLDANKLLYDTIAAVYPVSCVILWGFSHGGMLTSLLATGKRDIPNIKGVVCHSCILNLAYAYSQAQFTADINTAYGITGTTPNTYAEKTAGFDPMLLDVSLFANKLYRFYASDQDTTVPIVQNAIPFQAKIEGSVAESKLIKFTGGHGEPNQFFPIDVVNFVNRCIQT